MRSLAGKIAKKEYSYTHGQLFSRISAVMKFVAEGAHEDAWISERGDDACRPRRFSACARAHQGEKCPGACAPNTDSCPREHCDTKSLSTVRVSHLLRAFLQALGKPDVPGLLKGARQHAKRALESSAGQLATRCEQWQSVPGCRQSGAHWVWYKTGDRR